MSSDDTGPSPLDFLPSSMRQKLTMERLTMVRALSDLQQRNDRLAELLHKWEQRGLHEFTCPVFDRHRQDPVCVCMLGATRAELAAITAERGANG